MSEIIYVVHPVNAEQKAELRKKGKIVDARFAGKDDKIFDANGKEVKASKPSAAKE